MESEKNIEWIKIERRIDGRIMRKRPPFKRIEEGTPEYEKHVKIFENYQKI